MPKQLKIRGIISCFVTTLQNCKWQTDHNPSSSNCLFQGPTISILLDMNDINALLNEHEKNERKKNLPWRWQWAHPVTTIIPVLIYFANIYGNLCTWYWILFDMLIGKIILRVCLRVILSQNINKLCTYMYTERPLWFFVSWFLAQPEFCHIQTDRKWTQISNNSLSSLEPYLKNPNCRTANHTWMSIFLLKISNISENQPLLTLYLEYYKIMI